MAFNTHFLVFFATAGISLSASCVEVSSATVPPSSAIGGDVPISLKIANMDAQPDNLRTIRCPSAFFGELRKTELGEGGIMTHEVKTIPVPAKTTLELASETYSVHLVQTNTVLKTGDRFKCTFSFQRNGRKEVEVVVAAQ